MQTCKQRLHAHDSSESQPLLQGRPENVQCSLPASADLAPPKPAPTALHPSATECLTPTCDAAAQVWLPVNAVFVLMLASGIISLQLLGVAMVTIMKNLTNLITISGDYFFFGRTYNIYVWLCLGIIIVSACTGMSTDLAFSWSGYSFQIANCFFTAGYSLLLRGTMDKVCLLPVRLQRGAAWSA